MMAGHPGNLTLAAHSMKGLWASFILAGLLAALSVTAAPGASAPVMLQEKDRGRTVTLKVGQKLVLNLRNPASGGYNTNPPIFDAAILRLGPQKKLPPEPRETPLAGDFGQLYYEWEAVAPGATAIIINIYRPWEKKSPEEFWRVKVKVE